MGEKAFASLSSGLLARKGQARPAMRPQGFAMGLGHPEDLGWNDMGYNDTEQDARRNTGPRLPASLSGPHASVSVGVAANVDLPAVVRQQDEIAREFAASKAEPEAPATAAATVPALASAPVAARSKRTPSRPPRRLIKGLVNLAPPPRDGGRKSAFTLRLDAERHLHLRLACAVQNRSAQQLVIEALDRLLDELPDVTRLAASLPGQAGAGPNGRQS